MSRTRGSRQRLTSGARDSGAIYLRFFFLWRWYELVIVIVFVPVE